MFFGDLVLQRFSANFA